MTEIKKKTFVYTRNSDLDSFNRESSSDTQIDKCKSYSELHNLEIKDIYREQVSGGVSLLKRKIFKQLFSQCSRGSVILFSRLDRMSRSIKDTLDFLDHLVYRLKDCLKGQTFRLPWGLVRSPRCLQPVVGFAL